MNLLFLYPKTYWETKMSVGRSLYPSYLEWYKYWKVNISGPGWPEWENNKSLKYNVTNLERLNQTNYDIIWGYKVQTVGAQQVNKIRLVSFNEANNREKTQSDIDTIDATHLLFNHYNDYKRWNGPQEKIWIGGHSWHTTGSEIDKYSFTDEDWNSRNIKRLSSGVHSKVYPMREKLNTLPDVTNHLHPGYRMCDREHIFQQYQNYCQILADSKVSLCCSSVYRYPLQKMVESARFGCAVVTDEPECPFFRSMIWHHCVQVSKEMSVDHINRLLLSEDLIEYAREGHETAMKVFHPEAWATRFATAIETGKGLK